MNTKELKEILTRIKNNDYVVYGSFDLKETVSAMMRHIGTTDPVLRDELIYSTFLKWTLGEALPTELMREILWTSLDDQHLFFQIGEKDTDSVFTRSFSVLMVPLALYMNEKKGYLSREDVSTIKSKVIKYLELEKDVRGYVEGKGWAHSTAHGADAMEDIARSRYMERGDLMELLDAAKGKVCIDSHTYIHEEDERMAVAVLSIFNREVLNRNDALKWISGFGGIKKPGMDPGDHPLYINTKNFLRSLYFKTLPRMEFESITKAILDTLEKLAE